MRWTRTKTREALPTSCRHVSTRVFSCRSADVSLHSFSSTAGPHAVYSRTTGPNASVLLREEALDSGSLSTGNVHAEKCPAKIPRCGACVGRSSGQESFAHVPCRQVS